MSIESPRKRTTLAIVHANPTPVPTRSSAEAILQLVSTYQGANGLKLSARTLWEKIVDFVHDGGCRFYRLSKYDRLHPDGPYLRDITYLVKGGFLELTDSGCLQLTPLGRCASFPRVITPELRNLQTAVAEVSSVARANQ